jgi:hypothetical protein
MLVALSAPLADENQQEELAGTLGAEPAAAAHFAAGLLSDPHPLVAAGAAAWLRGAFTTERVRQWRDSLPEVVDTGDIPTVEQADAWAQERTLGLIKRFPITITPDVVCLLATALATKVSWEVPFAWSMPGRSIRARGRVDCGKCSAPPKATPATASSSPIPTERAPWRCI